MNLAENIKIAVSSIRSNAMRAFLTMLGIIIGVASVIAIITIGDSGRDYLVNLINEIGGQSVNISLNTKRAVTADSITDDDIEALRGTEIIEYVSPMVTELASVATDRTSGVGIVIGSNEELDKIMNLKMTYGRYFSNNEYDSQRNVAVIDSDTAKAFFGTENAIGESIEIKINKRSETFKIVGICYINLTKAMSESGSISSIIDSFGMFGENEAFARVYVPSSSLLQISESSIYTNCYLTSTSGESLEKAGQVAVNILSSRHNNFEREVYKSTNMSTIVDLLDAVINIFTIFISSVGAISLIVGGIGVMNIMLVSVTERTREIGIRKSLGARTSTILKQFLTESVILCLIGGTIGIVIGLILSLSVSSYMNVPMSLKFSTILIAVGFSTLIGITSGIYPAKKAAKMPPIEALRRE